MFAPHFAEQHPADAGHEQDIRSGPADHRRHREHPEAVPPVPHRGLPGSGGGLFPERLRKNLPHPQHHVLPEF